MTNIRFRMHKDIQEFAYNGHSGLFYFCEPTIIRAILTKTFFFFTNSSRHLPENDLDAVPSKQKRILLINHFFITRRKSIEIEKDRARWILDAAKRLVTALRARAGRCPQSRQMRIPRRGQFTSFHEVASRGARAPSIKHVRPAAVGREKRSNIISIQTEPSCAHHGRDIFIARELLAIIHPRTHQPATSSSSCSSIYIEIQNASNLERGSMLELEKFSRTERNYCANFYEISIKSWSRGLENQNDNFPVVFNVTSWQKMCRSYWEIKFLIFLTFFMATCCCYSFRSGHGQL